MDMPEPADIELFMRDVREGFGDRKMDAMSTDFWADKLAPTQPEYANAGEQYRAMNHGTSLPEDWVAAYNRQGIAPAGYETVQQRGLEDYANKPKASLALPTAGEADQSYVMRFDAQIRPNLAELPADVVEAATVAYNEARERLDNGTAYVDTRTSGDGVGIFGESPASRSLQGAVSYRDLAANASQSAHDVMAAARRAEQAQRTASAVLPRSGYQPVAGEAAHTIRQTTRQYAGNQGLFR